MEIRKKMKMRSLKIVFYTICTVTLFFACEKEGNSGHAQLLEEIKRTRVNFQEAWLKGDSAKVMELMSNDIVFMPHHGDPMILGKADLAKFWFDPSYPPTNVVEFTADFQGADVSNDLGYSFGRFRLSYDYEGKNYSNEGNFLTVVKKEGEEWKISKLIFNDPQPEVREL